MLLPGGFRLPLSLIVSEYLYFDTYDGHQMDCQTWMPGRVKAYLESHLQACQVISENTRMDVDADSCVFYGEYICLENIGFQVLYQDHLRHLCTDLLFVGRATDIERREW